MVYFLKPGAGHICMTIAHKVHNPKNCGFSFGMLVKDPLGVTMKRLRASGQRKGYAMQILSITKQ